ncbi:isochorismatase family protein [Cellulomonas dongxiuzhuiae]|uniref:Isochorismatase family protein n=1 Tax=Cellulomonas dongxiuzhuiae TaxID=2819979 RepID=A0ABX8GG53_9CELL|nr:isochorismatase family protein [Cellulomonas dongxiuzhuiae]MBO3093582.1 isochorismatase family protein [Cellulomonas dongxiuzhuiae]QWC14707.1 isochorismatase family protein [Cellulomonas dongxiuzhuiae]
MTTLENRDRSALLVIDVQTGVLVGAHDRDGVLGRIGVLLERARGDGTEVVWVQHSSDQLPVESEPWQIVSELTVRDGEPVVHKRYGDAFEATDLEDVLAARGIGRLVVAGAQTDACVRSTLHGALTRGYDVTLVSDAHTTEDLSAWGAPSPAEVVAHTNLYWGFEEAPGRTAGTATAAEVELGGASG